MSEPKIVHLVPHTHWDREWYEPFQTFRMRLVELIDQLLERMDRDDRLRFTLDGQAATVDDYLEVRPEAEALIRRLIAEGRLAIGPWQILLDEFLVSGETIIRNLEAGWGRAEALGRAMPVGYLPDMFGHIAQMPQILQRAGIQHAVVWRGVPNAIDADSFDWVSPDGSRVDTTYLVGGYGNGAYLFDVPDRLAAKLEEFCRTSAAFYGEGPVLAMYGTDHAVPSPRLADLIDGINAGGGGVHVRMETLAEYVAQARPPNALAWSGELRSGARANMLVNVISARVDLKAAAARAERLLERYAEPLAAIHGGPWPGRLLQLTWQRMIDNSAHDSICGCSHDLVTAQVIGRYAEAEQIATGIVRSTLRQIADLAPGGTIAVINPSPIQREALIELDVACAADWTSIALQAGNEVLATQEVGRADPVIASLRMPARDIGEFFRRRRHGRELLGRMINGIGINTDGHAELPRLDVLVDAVPDPLELDIEELLATATAVTDADPDVIWELVVLAPDRRLVVARVSAPALGWTVLNEVNGASVLAEPIPNPVHAADQGLGNGLVEIVIGRDGSFQLSGSDSTLDGAGRIVDGGEFGDSYNYGPPTTDTLVEGPSTTTVRTVEQGPIRGIVEIIRTYAWPRGIEVDGSGRTPETVPTELTTRLELRADEPFVRVRIEFENRSRDHRVRWHMPLPAPIDGSSAEGQFAVTKRGLTVEDGHGEVPLPTFPASGFIHVDGLSVLLDQVTEYEVLGGNELALTVLRSFGLISRNANPYREDPAGPEIRVPEAQLIGARTFRFALYPHTGSWEDAATLAAVESYRHPFMTTRATGTPDRSGDNDGDPHLSYPESRAVAGPRIVGHGVVMTALRRRGRWLELRLVNEGSNATRAEVHADVDDACEIDVLGRIGPAIPVEIGSVKIELGPWEIRTIGLHLPGIATT